MEGQVSQLGASGPPVLIPPLRLGLGPSGLQCASPSCVPPPVIRVGSPQSSACLGAKQSLRCKLEAPLWIGFLFPIPNTSRGHCYWSLLEFIPIIA